MSKGEKEKMDLFDYLREIRLKLRLTVPQLARKLGVSPMYLNQIERSSSKKGQYRSVPSVEFLKKVANLAGSNPEERKILLRKLLLERAKVFHPDLKEYFEEQREKERTLLLENSMPSAFLERLGEDLKKVEGSVDSICEKVRLTREELEDVLEGRLVLSKRTVISLALALNQPVEEYLILAEYMPDRLKKFVESDRSRNYVFFRKLSYLSEDDVVRMLDILDKILEILAEKSRGEQDS